ncbi:MAG: hypothetical protein JSV16_02345 [Candidatus Hydrogenedentota bacterium]|nr:MAG: hypothetical protein JSV16_02345 [Candidatus Hydrogenedentota bacterium]
MKELRAALSFLSMWRNLHMSPEALQKKQARKLREIVHHAYSTTPYYHNLFDAAGIRPGDIGTLSDLSRIPISRKENMLKVPLEDRIARGTDVRK